MNDAIQLNDRIDIFRQLSVDEVLGSVKSEIFDGLLTEYYDDFVTFCEFLRSPECNTDDIINISCHISDNEIHFDIKRKG